MAGDALFGEVVSPLAVDHRVEALALFVDGEFDGVLAAQVQDGLITGIYIVRNPQKLTRVGEETSLSLR